MTCRSRTAAAAAALLVLITTTPRAQDAAVAGVVFLDANGNGIRDGGEAGVAGVAVSNQHAVAVTDARGRYRLADGGTGVVFVSVPDRHRASGSFWKPAAAAVDFALAARPGGDAAFTFLHASDPHTDAASLPRLASVRAVAAAGVRADDRRPGA